MASNIVSSPASQTSPQGLGSDGSNTSLPVTVQLLNAFPWAKLSSTLAAIGVGNGGAHIVANDSPYAATTAVLVLLVVTTALIYGLASPSSSSSSSPLGAIVSNKHLPAATPPPAWFDIGALRHTRDFVDHALDYMLRARTQFHNKPYRMHTDSGEATILPVAYANEIKSDDRLSFMMPLKRAMHAELRGFDMLVKGGMENHLVIDVVRQDLTRELGKVTAPLHEETAFALELLLGGGDGNEAPRELCVKNFAQELVARLSSRVFLGEELCRNREWLDITIRCTTTNVQAAWLLRLFPGWLRPLMNEILPLCRQMRAEQAKAGHLILPIVAQRRALRNQLIASGASPSELRAAIKNDGLEWFERMASRDGRLYSPELAQITLSVAAIHTTSDLLTQLMLDLAEHKETILPALREELVTVLGGQGWKKTSLYALKLMDSCIRESQRLKPIGSCSMRREVLDDMTLSDGTHLRKGSQIMIAALSHWDPTIYENPTEWDGFRFYRQAQAQAQAESSSSSSGESESTATPAPQPQTAAATTTTDHFAFGHGQHACPGRFFAINEVKIALAHLIMKYDWELVAGKPKPKTLGFTMMADWDARMRIWKRTPEIDLDALEVA